jgi:hypothetical protein
MVTVFRIRRLPRLTQVKAAPDLNKIADLKLN